METFEAIRTRRTIGKSTGDVPARDDHRADPRLQPGRRITSSRSPGASPSSPVPAREKTR